MIDQVLEIMKNIESEVENINQNYLIMLFKDINNIEKSLLLEIKLKQIIENLENLRKNIDIINFNKMFNKGLKKYELDDYICEIIQTKTPQYDREKMYKALEESGYKKEDFIKGYIEKRYCKFNKKKK